MSRYSSDSRVVLNADGSARISEGAPGEGDWHVQPGDAGGWVVTNPIQGGIFEGANWLRVFPTRDDGIAAVIGPAQVSA